MFSHDTDGSIVSILIYLHCVQEQGHVIHIEGKQIGVRGWAPEGHHQLPVSQLICINQVGRIVHVFLSMTLITSHYY